MATRNQLVRLYFPVWRRAFTANWLRVRGCIIAAPQRSTSQILDDVEQIAEAAHRAEGVPLEERHLRHACHILALGEDISSAALDNRQLDRCLLAFRLLADPDDLKTMVAWTNPRQPDLRRLSWAIRHSPHSDDYIERVCADKFGTREWRSLDLTQLHQLVTTLKNRPVAHPGRAVRAPVEENCPF